ncbi:hypothetical protein EV127DRAFT_416140 [Xylaria flabelliformis]|nr:hypothetical protein EV127DRAFT_416140 [Xylaria flabelliformis]
MSSDPTKGSDGTMIQSNPPGPPGNPIGSSTGAPTSTIVSDDHLLGPLTTVFSADPTCLTLLLGECGSSTACTGWLGQTCNLESPTKYWPSNDVSCWPSWTSGANIQEYLGWGFYSPGLVCPSGYTSACSTTAGSTGNFQFQFPPTAGETALGCCPTSFICNKVPGDNQVCIRTVTSTSYTGLKCSGSIYNQLTVYTVPATAADDQITVSSHVLSAQLIQLNWQSSDRASFSTSGPTASMSTSTTSPSMPIRGSESKGLTAGEKAGIGIGTSFGAISLEISIWYLFRRFRKQRVVSSGQIDRPYVRELGGKQIYEASDPSAPVWELPSHQP